MGDFDYILLCKWQAKINSECFKHTWVERINKMQKPTWYQTKTCD